VANDDEVRRIADGGIDKVRRSSHVTRFEGSNVDTSVDLHTSFVGATAVGHRRSPYEQNTQQSPGRGASTDPQPGQLQK
jgi:allantoicase